MVRVVNKKNERFDIDITRKSKWGNPFRIGEDGTRKEVIEKYREHILKNKDLMNSLYELEDKVLGCVCKPKKCHGDVLVELVKRRKSIKTFKQKMKGM